MKSILRSLKYGTVPKVNLFIIGEQKCGTSSLHDLITKNPKVLEGYRKECQYFNYFDPKKDSNYKSFHKMFKPIRFKQYDYFIDSTPAYFFDKKIPDLIHDYNPDAKFILVFRNPLDRIISAYNFYFSNIISNLDHFYENFFRHSPQGMLAYDFLKANHSIDLNQLLLNELNESSPLNLIERSRYGKHLELWFSKFPKNQFQILWFENLVNSDFQKEEIDKVSKFLNLKLSYDFPLSNKTIGDKAGKFEFNNTIKDLFKEDLLLLEKLLNTKTPYDI